jgi:hypothetical protein
MGNVRDAGALGYSVGTIKLYLSCTNSDTHILWKGSHANAQNRNHGRDARSPEDQELSSLSRLVPTVWPRSPHAVT